VDMMREAVEERAGQAFRAEYACLECHVGD
jgi:hypothetical protein